MAALDSAHIGFVHFDSSVHHRLFRRRHCRPDPMAQIPRRLVADSEGPLDLVGAHALAGFAEQVDGSEPLNERQMGIVEDAVCRDGELVIAVFAVENLGGFYEAHDRPFAARTFGLVRPAKALQKLAAKIVIGERIAGSSVDEKSKQTELRKVPMRKLLASVKQGIRKQIRPSEIARKPKKQ